MDKEKQKIIEKTEIFVRETLAEAEGGHDWWHIYRVRELALHIAEGEKADMFIVNIGALLHDIADAKFHKGDEEVGPRIAEDFLISMSVEPEIINHVINIIKYISFKNRNEKNPFVSKELQVIQDADRLDAMGAIGIARAFNFGGFKGRALYDPAIPPNPNQSKEEYKAAKAPTINHFYEKLLLLKDMMNTHTGKKMAEGRHLFMEKYLEQFYAEWEGEK